MSIFPLLTQPKLLSQAVVINGLFLLQMEGIEQKCNMRGFWLPPQSR